MNINDRIKYARYTSRNLMYPDNREVQGRKRERTLLDWVNLIGLIALVIIASLVIIQFIFPAQVAGAKEWDACGLEVVQCDNELIIPVKQVRYEKVYITHYTKADCTNPECRTASGLIAQVGFVACSRSIPLGSIIEIQGERYKCQDRYALWVDKKRDLPTVDIFTNKTTQEALAFGKQKAIIEIIE